MTGGDLIVALVTIVASLFLATRAMRAHGLSFERKATMAVAWLVVFLVAAFLFERLAR